MNFLKTTLITAALVATGLAGNAAAATASGEFKVQITITESCSFSTSGASDINFGNKARASAGDLNNTGALVVNCTQGTPYNIGLSKGTSTDATETARFMTSGTNKVPYSLYRDSGRTNYWGNTVGTNTHPGTGTNSDQSIPVYGRVLGGADVNVPAGLYTDTLVATITY